MNRIGVMQLTDTLLAGGLERVAVNVANHLPQDRFRSFLCTTRIAGPLESLIAPHVQKLILHRKEKLDLPALRRFTTFLRQNDVRILHVHGTSLFFGVMASLCRPHPAVIWHDHFGRYATEERPVWLFRMAARFCSAVIAVNKPLADWSINRLKVPSNRVWYIPNFVPECVGKASAGALPGQPGSRIVCVANLRREKDHLNLLEAMKQVVQTVPSAHLLLLGSAGDPEYLDQIQQQIKGPLAGHVTWLGCRNDVNDVLQACDVGVLSSASEGLPLALIEYGNAGLPAVATRIGQCAEVLDNGAAGLLVPPASPNDLAAGLLNLLKHPKNRQYLGQKFQARVRQNYSAERVICQMCDIYKTVLNN
jgi:glycosyltransferase involved in cell wall biosynthesis